MTNKKPVRKREARKIARFLAGAIIYSVLEDGWGPDDLIARYGEDGVQAIRDELEYFGAWLEDTGQRT